MTKPLTLAWAGVDLFFVLSGFLIFSILLDGDRSVFWSFYPRRAARVLPLYAILLAVLVAGLAANDHSWISLPRLFESVDQLWLYFCMLQNLDQFFPKGGINWLGPSWSLAIEEQFYILAPLMVSLAGKGRRFGLLMTSIVLGSLMVRVALFVVLQDSPDDCSEWLYFFTLSRLDGLGLGGLIAWTWARPQLALALGRHRAKLWFVFFSVLGYCLFAIKFGRTRHPEFLLMLAVGSGALLCLTLTGAPTLCAILRNRCLRYFGRISFGLYMIHIPVLGLLSAMLISPTAPIVLEKPRWIMLTAFGLSVLLADLSFRFVEGPILERVRRSFPYRT